MDILVAILKAIYGKWNACGQRASQARALTLLGLEGHICPSLVKDGKDIYVPPW